MLLSIFTPTHYTNYLLDAYRSLTRQRWTDWEWVILPSASSVTIPAEIRADHRVRVLSNLNGENRIGMLKNTACSQCRGDVLIELDHDDMLVPGETLHRIAEKAAQGAGFIYSDSAMFKPDCSSHQWSSSFGWEHYPFRLYGRTLHAARCFPITPRSLCEIYNAPDHVRCWSRTAYIRAGGHDVNMSVGDDHDLMCKTYLAGEIMAHTGGCHYLYRLHPANTVKSREKLIQDQVRENCRKYVGPLIREWCRREKLPLVSINEMIASGWSWTRDLKDGFGIPNSVGAIVCDNQVQFCPGDEFSYFMNYAYDALVPGGYLELRFPSASGQAAFLDPRAKVFLTAATFFSYTRKQFATDPERACRFQFVHAANDFKDDFHSRNGLMYTTVTLMALKEGRYPGLQYI